MTNSLVKMLSSISDVGEIEKLLAKEMYRNETRKRRYKIHVFVYKRKYKDDPTLQMVWLESLKYTDVAKNVEESDRALKAIFRRYQQLTRKSEPQNSITDEDIQNAREFRIETLLSTNLRKTGDKTLTRCPFHEEKTPSFYVFNDNSFHCFSCGAHGNNAIDFVMKHNNLDFINAVRSLI